MHDDGLAYVKEADWPTMYGPDGAPKGDPAYQMAEGMAALDRPESATQIADRILRRL